MRGTRDQISRIVARFLSAGEFTPTEWRMYQQQHPGADVRDHTIVRPKRTPKPKVKSDAPKSDASKEVQAKPDTSKLKKLGEGASRVVYEDGDTVVKVAKDKKSSGDNKQEVELSGKSELFAKITEHGADYSWIRQEKLTPMKDASALAKYFGVSAKAQKAVYDIPVYKSDNERKLDEALGRKPPTIKGNWLAAATYAAAGNPPAHNLDPSVKKYQAALQKIQKDIPDLDVADFGSVHQWGLDKNGNPKIADYGFGNR